MIYDYRWVGGSESELSEATEERKLDQRRAVTGEDVKWFLPTC